MTMTDRLEQLVSNIERWADRRRSKAEQCPDDKRNVSSFESLDKLAGKLSAISNFVEMIERAAELNDVEANDAIAEVQSKHIARYGFDGPQDGDPAKFLDELTWECLCLLKIAQERLANERLAKLPDESRRKQ